MRTLLIGLVLAALAGCSASRMPQHPGRFYVVEREGASFLLFYDWNNSSMAEVSPGAKPDISTLQAVKLRSGIPGNFYRVTFGQDTFLLFYDYNNSALCKLGSGSKPGDQLICEQVSRQIPSGRLYDVSLGQERLLLFYDVNNSSMRLVSK